jgi:hypothetical protein
MWIIIIIFVQVIMSIILNKRKLITMLLMLIRYGINHERFEITETNLNKVWYGKLII